jgi:hypothetical protein
MTIAKQSAKYHGSIHIIEACPLPTHTKEAAIVIKQRMRPNAIAITISLPLAANPTIQPTNNAATTFPIAIPSVAKNT